MEISNGTMKSAVTTIATQNQTVSPPGLFAGSLRALKYAHHDPIVAATQMMKPHKKPP
jgi:hypothetical protein